MTKSEVEKIREFWIQEDDNQLLEVLRYKPFSSDYVRYKTFHVIEYSAYKQLMKEIESLQAKLKVACDALEYYSDEENHNNDFQFDLSDVPYITNEGEHDCYLVGGKRAREALAEIRKKGDNG